MSTGVKHDSGKPAMELIDADAMEDLARVLEFGRRKYGAHNWRGGIGIGRLIGAALRHTFAFIYGSSFDYLNWRINVKRNQPAKKASSC